MVAVERLSRAARIYVVTVILAGGIAALHSLVALGSAPTGPSWYVLAVLTLLSGSFTVRIPTIPARLSVSETFVFAAVMMFGPAAATVIVVLDTLVISFWLRRRSNSPTRILFNISAPALAIWIASRLFYLVTGIPPLSVQPQPVIGLIFPLLGLSVVYFLLNSWLVAFAVAFQKQQSAVEIWRDHFLWLSLNYFSGASVAALLMPYLLQIEYAYVRIIGVLLPILTISYLTLKTALGRVEDANQHLEELNRLYISTIETLAMAIDAKDQITHGHIRRVQRYAVGLAHHMGVTDTLQIRAIEAASLLHDMGKLAIPEHILNKPGRLTPAEFERMKTHADVGAEILSAIKFPYPVVPIVRHHHEAWDGSGYPDGLAGTVIPIGARILSVVDCYDALTSDRPYRPKLPSTEAVAILLERRGNMYDPLVVDAFIAIHAELISQQTPSAVPDHVKEASTMPGNFKVTTHGNAEVLAAVSPAAEEAIARRELAGSFATTLSTSDLMTAVATALGNAINDTTWVLFLYDSHSDELREAFSVGEQGCYFRGLRIPRGQRLTGWVGANLRTIINSDPALDLGEQLRLMHPRLQSCLATPVLTQEQLVGVISLYSTVRNAFNERHKTLIEQVANRIASSLRVVPPSGGPNGSRRNFQFSDLPSPEIPKPHITTRISKATQGREESIIVITNLSKDAAFTEVAPCPDMSLDQLVRTLSIESRSDDALFRYDERTLIFYMSGATSRCAKAVATRLASDLIGELGGAATKESLAVTVASAPTNGCSLSELVNFTRRSPTALDYSVTDNAWVR